MRVLIACEESQTICKAFRAKGHEAFSCDIKPCSGGHPEWHIQDDVLKHLNESWDLIIAHPPCTYLTTAGAPNLPKHPERIEKGFEAAEFFKKFLDAPCKHIAIENPVPMSVFKLPPYSQIVYPYQFGDASCKKICLWLKGLPPLKSTNDIGKESVEMYYWIDKKTGKRRSGSKWYNNCGKGDKRSQRRSKTFKGFADAVVEQWSTLE